jgi:hypothetical protein
MLEPQERRLLFEMLKPPAGYAFDEAIATTFSIELTTLLGIPLAFTRFTIEDEEGRPVPSTLALLEAARRHSERISVFCQAGRVAVPVRRQPLLAFLESSVTEVAAPAGGVFHPKLWVLRYVCADAPSIYRLLCLSRNLTTSTAWDVSVSLEGVVTDRQVGFTRNRPLCDLVAALPDLAVRPVAKRNVARAARFAEELRFVDFKTPVGFTDLAFHPIGIDGHRRSPLDQERIDRLLVISPFVSQGCLTSLAENGGGHVLISRLEELDRLPPGALQDFAEVLVLRDQAALEYDKDDEGESSLIDAQLVGLHAKVFVLDQGWNATLYLGSANATDAAFHQNVEFLTSLTGTRKAIGVEAILGKGDNEQLALRDLLDTYTPTDGAREDELIVSLEARLEELRRVIACAQLIAEVEVTADQFHLTVKRRQRITMPNGDSDAAIELWPCSMPRDAAKAFQTAENTVADFGNVTIRALTSFFAVRIEVKAEGVARACTFVVNLPLIGAPEDRRAEILRNMLADRDTVLRFLLFLLATEETGPIDATVGGALESVTGASVGGATREGILELLLHRLHRDPSRLEHVAETIEALSKAPDAAGRLPEGFEDVWRAVWSAHRQIKERTRR